MKSFCCCLQPSSSVAPTSAGRRGDSSSSSHASLVSATIGVFQPVPTPNASSGLPPRTSAGRRGDSSSSSHASLVSATIGVFQPVPTPNASSGSQPRSGDTLILDEFDFSLSPTDRRRIEALATSAMARCTHSALKNLTGLNVIRGELDLPLPAGGLVNQAATFETLRLLGNQPTNASVIVTTYRAQQETFFNGDSAVMYMRNQKTCPARLPF